MAPPTRLNQPSGLVSVSFRQMEPAAIVELARDNGLEMIEWGGDIHVPPGDLVRAREVNRITRAGGLQVAAYGSYYRLGAQGQAHSFETILETAVALKAPVIRVWAGSIGSEAADDALWDSVRRDADRIATLASRVTEMKICVALEFHGGTLNDAPSSARRLWKELEHPNLRSLWQPLPSLTAAEQDESLVVLLPHLAHLHVFHWLPGPPIERRPLSEGATDWSRWLATIEAYRATSPSSAAIPALLEFVAHDDPGNLPADAAALHRLLRA